MHNTKQQTLQSRPKLYFLKTSGSNCSNSSILLFQVGYETLTTKT